LIGRRACSAVEQARVSRRRETFDFADIKIAAQRLLEKHGRRVQRAARAPEIEGRTMIEIHELGLDIREELSGRVELLIGGQRSLGEEDEYDFDGTPRDFEPFDF
jgi:hypothetical protein